MVSIDFTYFKTQFSSFEQDALFIYDGVTATGNNIGKLMGDYSKKKTGNGSTLYGVGRGNTNSADLLNIFKPTIFSATNSTGRLTLKFVVQTTSAAFPGWEATVSTYTPIVPGCSISMTASSSDICAFEKRVRLF